MSFPNVIDNTIRKAFIRCPTYAKHAHIENLRVGEGESVDLLFGAAFATGMETARKLYFQMPGGEGDGIAEDAIDRGIDAALAHYGDFNPPEKSFKTPDRLAGALRYYFEQWPLGADGLTPLPDGIECSFAIEIPVLHPDTGKWIKYAGRYDMAAVDSQGRIHVVDEKTASRLGDSFASKWDMDSQMTGYIWSKLHGLRTESGLKESEMPEVMADIRAVSILSREYGHMDVPIVRPAWMIERWHEQMVRDVVRMVDAYRSNEWDMAMHENSCVAYMRPCEYTRLCTSPNPERLMGDYKRVVWDPLAPKGK